MPSCKHLNFQVEANIGRLTRSETDQTVIQYQAEIKIHCVDCLEPFEFVGLPMGMMPSEPCCSVDALEARMPIKPMGESMPTDVAGFKVKVTIDKEN